MNNNTEHDHFSTQKCCNNSNVPVTVPLVRKRSTIATLQKKEAADIYQQLIGPRRQRGNEARMSLGFHHSQFFISSHCNDACKLFIPIMCCHFPGCIKD